MRFRSWILSAAMLLLAASPMFATNLAVGNPSCESSYTHFSTIQSAVNAAPASGTTTIYVCPGVYNEQVLIIGKKITMKGVAYGNSNASIIAGPTTGGFLPLATSTNGGNIWPLVLVQNSPATIIEDMTMDAGNSDLESLGCGGDPVGVFYQNSSGTLTRNTVLNAVMGPNLGGCQGGLGIYVETGTSTGNAQPSSVNNVPSYWAANAPFESATGSSTVVVSYNNVNNFSKNGITANATGTDVTVTYNTVVGQGATTGVYAPAGQNSVQIAFGAIGTVTYNTVGSDVWAPDVFGDTGDAAAGILVGYGSENITISNNQVSNTQYGIAVEGETGYGVGDGATITNNTITATHLYDAIDMCANNVSATGNKITGADESGIHSDDACFTPVTGNSVSTNTINSACAGVLVGPFASTTAVSGNTYYNAASQVTTGSDTCSPALMPRKGATVAKAHGKLSPARPSKH